MSFLSNLFIILFSLFAITTAILLLTKKKIGYYFSKALNMLSSIEGIVSLGLGVLMIIEGIKDSSEYAVLLYILAFLFLVFGATIVALNVVAFIYYSKRKEYFKQHRKPMHYKCIGFLISTVYYISAKTTVFDGGCRHSGRT